MLLFFIYHSVSIISQVNQQIDNVEIDPYLHKPPTRAEAPVDYGLVDFIASNLLYNGQIAQSVKSERDFTQDVMNQIKKESSIDNTTYSRPSTIRRYNDPIVGYDPDINNEKVYSKLKPGYSSSPSNSYSSDVEKELSSGELILYGICGILVIVFGGLFYYNMLLLLGRLLTFILSKVKIGKRKNWTEITEDEF